MPNLFDEISISRYHIFRMCFYFIIILYPCKYITYFAKRQQHAYVMQNKILMLCKVYRVQVSTHYYESGTLYVYMYLYCISTVYTML